MTTEHYQLHMIEETEARLNTHEAVCAHRYDQIMEKFNDGKKKMDKLEETITSLDRKIAWASGIIAAVAAFGPHIVDILKSVLGI
jgi:NAD(P)H-dependent FMN reductase